MQPETTGARRHCLARAIAMLALALGAGARAQSVRTWDNDSSDGQWSTAANWSGDTLPAAGDHVVFDGAVSLSHCTADAVSSDLGSLTLGNGYTSTVTFLANAVTGGMVLTVAGDVTLNSGNLAFTGDPTAIGDGTPSTKFGVGYAVHASNVTIAASASINADDRGFGPYSGPGSYSNRDRGPSYGGNGGANSGAAYIPTERYGAARHPTALGSGGTKPGGGAIKLVVSGLTTVNGRLSADATQDPVNRASGAGGSIWIAGGALAGNGIISASSRLLGNNGGGGGGRIDIGDTVNDFGGTLRADGAPAGSAGSRGCISGRTGSILLPQSAGTGLTWGRFLVTNEIRFGNALAVSNVVVTNGGALYLDANTGEDVHVFGSLTVYSNGSVVCMGNPLCANQAPTGAVPYGSGVTILASNVTIHAGGRLSADAWGHYAEGPGFAGSGSGGCYGGQCGTSAYGRATVTYGPVTNVTALGSGGERTASTSGGGAIRLIVAETLTINGTISADGESKGANSPGASGGSIWIACAVLAGSGAIAANGGNANTSAHCAGGGGRIHLQYSSKRSPNPIDDGTVSANGGFAGGTFLGDGAGGTIVLDDLSDDEPYGTLIVSNNRNATWAKTTLPTNEYCFAGTPATLLLDRVYVRNKAVFQVPTGKTMAVTRAFTNGAVFLADVDSTVALVGTNDATVGGSNTFANFTVQSVEGVKTVRFAAGHTNAVTGRLALEGARLLSSVDGSRWGLALAAGGTQSIGAVAVKDCDASGGLTLRAGMDSSDLKNNLNWEFGGVRALLFIR
jgi:hypothetical protein